MEKQEIGKKIFVIEVTCYADGTNLLERKNTGFSQLELMGLLNHTLHGLNLSFTNGTNDEGYSKVVDSELGSPDSMRIEEIRQMSVRVYNALKAKKINTAGDLRQLKPSTFLKMHGVGRHTLADLLWCLKRYKIELKEEE
jgi:hypothetical protein